MNEKRVLSYGLQILQCWFEKSNPEKSAGGSPYRFKPSIFS
jgi:hypothetical protein